MAVHTLQSPAAERPQHLAALAHANQVRLARANLKRAVNRGERRVAEIVRSTPWEAETMPLGELLCAQQRWGRIRSRKLLSRIGLNENKRLAALTQRQRTLLCLALDAGPQAASELEPFAAASRAVHAA